MLVELDAVVNCVCLWCVCGASGVCGGQVACVGGKWHVCGGQVECHLFIAAVTSPTASEYLPERWYAVFRCNRSCNSATSMAYTQRRGGEGWEGKEMEDR